MSIDICNELHQNFIDFAYEANSQRAFPDARDGLKPGQRACLWEMYDKGYSSNKPHVKSAKIDGGVAAEWWPHGTVAIYETFARMSQPWINNIPEVDWHGANGSIVMGSAPAADRYTEARLSKATEDGMFTGLKKKNVPMIDNYLEDAKWPEVLPAIMPRLMVNGSQGIGVTIANVWLPHNLTDIGTSIKNYILNNTIDYNKLAPDFPTGGIIINKDELSSIYLTGKGKVVTRGRVEIDDNIISITQLPYQVYVEPYIDSIKELVIKNEITGIKDIINKTDKKRVLIEIECLESPSKILTKLYALTDLQKNFNANQFALVGKTPKLLTLKDYYNIYIEHNISCIKREYEFDLSKAKDREEIVDGLLKALLHIDEIIALIKKSESSKAAKISLQNTYGFTERQATAIVDMKLGRLAHLESVELENEKKELVETIENCNKVLKNKDAQLEILIGRLEGFIKKYGTPRCTELTQITIEKEAKEIQNVAPEEVVVVVTENGYIKRVPKTAFKTQKRGGKGIKTQDDISKWVFKTNTIDTLMVFTSLGQMYRLLVNDIPVGTNTTKGSPISSLIELEAGEQIMAVTSLFRNTDAKYVLFVTKGGIVKKSSLEDYSKTKKKNGIKAITLREGDSLAAVTFLNEEDIMLLTRNGMCIRVASTDFGVSSRIAQGVIGIGLKGDDQVIALLPIKHSDDQLAIFTQQGLGKKTPLSDYPKQQRAGKGLACIKFANDTDALAGGLILSDDDLVLVCGKTKSLCVQSSDLSSQGRATIGTKVISNNNIVSVSKV